MIIKKMNSPRELNEMELEKVIGGETIYHTRMVCSKCKYSKVEEGNFTGVSGMTCPNCLENTYNADGDATTTRPIH